MAARKEWTTIQDLAIAANRHESTVRKNVKQAHLADPTHPGLRKSFDADAGSDRWEIGPELSAQWLTAWARKDERKSTRHANRTNADHLASENDLLHQSLRHSEIRSHDLELQALRDKFEAAEADNTRLRAELLAMHEAAAHRLRSGS